MQSPDYILSIELETGFFYNVYELARQDALMGCSEKGSLLYTAANSGECDHRQGEEEDMKQWR